MGRSYTVADLLTADLLAPQLPTPVSLATLSIEGALPGLVGGMECGVGLLQLVCVSSICVC